MSGPGFDVILEVTAFFFIVWFFEKSFQYCKLSGIFGAIVGGIICGPNVLDFVPYSCSHKDVPGGEYCQEPTPFVLMGILGVTFLIMESGTECEYHKVKPLFWQAFLVGSIGTILPVAFAIGVTVMLGYDAFPNGFSVGAAVAPTSVGIAIKCLKQYKQLNSYPGRLITTAAIVDDIFCLVLLVILIKLAEGEFTAATIILPFVNCFIFVGVGALFSVMVWPRCIPQLLHRLPSDGDGVSIRDMGHVGIMLSFLLGFGWVGSKIGSHLLGAFVAGMSFAQIPRSHYVWNRQMKRVCTWCVRMFFGATVGFIIPVKIMFQFGPFWKGCVLCLVACVLGKVISAVHIGEWRWVVGIPMIGRGEFNYLVTETATSMCYAGAKDGKRRAMRRLLGGGDAIDIDCQKMMDEDVFAFVIWALVLTVVITPIWFEYELKRAFAGKERSGIKRFVIKAQGPHHTGMNYEIMDVLHGLHLDVLEAKLETDGNYVYGEWIVMVTDLTDELDHEKIEEIEHMIHEAVNDEDTEIIICYDWDFMNHNKSRSTSFGSSDSVTGSSPKDGQVNSFAALKSKNILSEEQQQRIVARQNVRNGKNGVEHLPNAVELQSVEDKWLEIRIMSKHDANIVADVLITLDKMGLHIMKAHTEEHQDREEEVFFAKERVGSFHGHVSRKVMRNTLVRMFQQHGMHCQILIKRIKAQDVHKLASHIHRSATYLKSVSDGCLLENSEEGYEIIIKSSHAERDDHIAAHLAAVLKAENYDVAAYDIDEAEDEERHLSIKMFIRTEIASPEGKVHLMKLINDCFEKQNMEVETKISIINKHTMSKMLGVSDNSTMKEFQTQATALMRNNTGVSVTAGDIERMFDDVDVTESPADKDNGNEGIMAGSLAGLKMSHGIMKPKKQSQSDWI